LGKPVRMPPRIRETPPGVSGHWAYAREDRWRTTVLSGLPISQETLVYAPPMEAALQNEAASVGGSGSCINPQSFFRLRGLGLEKIPFL